MKNLSKINHDDLFNFLLFVLLGAVTGVFLTLFITSQNNDFLYRYQALIGALLALAGAAFTIYKLEKQISTQKEQIDKETERYQNTQRKRGLALRSQMPMALDEIANYSQECLKYLDRTRADIPAVSTHSLTTLGQVIEYMDDQSALELYEVLSFYQVQCARLIHSAPPTNTLDAGRFYDSLRLYEMACNCLGYARNETTSISPFNPSKQNMHHALRCYNRNYQKLSDHYIDVFKYINRLHPDY